MVWSHFQILLPIDLIIRFHSTLYAYSQCLFEPRVIEFNQKRSGSHPFSSPDVTDEIVEQIGDHIVRTTASLMVDAPFTGISYQTSPVWVPIIGTRHRL